MSIVRPTKASDRPNERDTLPERHIPMRGRLHSSRRCSPNHHRPEVEPHEGGVDDDRDGPFFGRYNPESAQPR
jgi:hypothetical protein